MSLSKIESSLLQIAQRTISDGSKKAASLGAAGAGGLRLVKDYTAGELVLNTLKSNQKSTVNSSASACANAISYLAPALAGLQEQQNLVQNALSLAVRAVSDPSVQTVSQLAAMNNQLTQVLNQIQNVVNTTHDANGNNILGYVTMQTLPFVPTSATYCPQIAADVLSVGFGITDFVSGVGSIIVSAVLVTETFMSTALGQLEVSVTAGSYGVAASAKTSTNSSLNSAYALLVRSNTNAAPSTLTDACAAAMNIIPTIDFNASTYVSQAFYDCKRIEQMSAQLPQLMVSAGVIGVGGAAANLLPIKMIAFMTNTAVTSGAGMTHIASNHAEPAGGTAESIAFANLLTTAEKAALISLIATPNVGLDAANIVGGAAGMIKPGAIITALQQITSFVNVAAGNNLLTINNPDCIICDTSGAAAASIAAATDIGGAITTWCGNGVGSSAILTGVSNGAVPASSAQYLVTKYFVNAAVSFINLYMPQMTSSEPVIQIGLKSTDTMALDIPNSSTSVIGLNINALSLSTVTNAQAAVTSLKAAATALAANIASINNQVNAFTARIVSLDVQDDILTDQLGAIENTDLAENADDLAGVNIQNFQAAALVGTQNVIQSTIDNAAQKIMRRAAVGG